MPGSRWNVQGRLFKADRLGRRQPSRGAVWWGWAGNRLRAANLLWAGDLLWAVNRLWAANRSRNRCGDAPCGKAHVQEEMCSLVALP